jgi:hypothetical protein
MDAPTMASALLTSCSKTCAMGRYERCTSAAEMFSPPHTALDESATMLPCVRMAPLGMPVVPDV